MLSSFRPRRPFVLLSLSAGLLSCGGDGPIEPPDPVPTKLAFVTAPPASAAAGEALSPQPVVQLQDATGTAVPKAGVVVTATLEGGTVSGGTATTGSNGRATFAALALDASAGSHTLKFDAPNLTGLAHALTLSASASISANSTTNQNGTAGLPVEQAPSIKVTDHSGNPVAGVAVTFRVVSGAGRVEGASQVTGSDGTATVGAWELGLSPGSNSLAAQAAGVAGLATFTATGVLMGSATADTANYHIGLAGSQVPGVPSVQVFVNGSPKAGALIRFRIEAGSGTVTVADAVSDASGIASAGQWTLGPTPGANILRVEAPGYRATPFRFRAWAVAALPARMVAHAGDNQVFGSELFTPIFPAVRVEDASGAPLAGFPVAFDPDNGSIDHDLAVTDFNGVATAGRWFVSGLNGTYELLAIAPELEGSPLQLTVTRMDLVPGQIEKLGEPIFSQVGTTLLGAPRIRVTSAGGSPLKDVSVQFSVASGGGSLGGATTKLTDASGEVAPDSWTLGTVSGKQALTAAVAPLAPFALEVTALAGPPASIVAAFGDNQSGPVYNPLPTRIGVRVLDEHGNPAAGVYVRFTVTQGGGRVTEESVPTGSTGEAATRWFLGGSPGPNLLSAAAQGFPSVLPLDVPATATSVSSPFNIEILPIGSLSAAQLDAVNAAVARWRTMIRSELQDFTLSLPIDACTPGGNQPAINQVVDDVLIMVDFSSIDGPGGVLGSAGPCVLRASSSLPVFGTITIDGADAAGLAASGELRDVMLHEMGHVLGFGTIWDRKNLLIGEGGSDPQYTGLGARQAYHDLGGNRANVAVENTGGPGTADSHWRESEFFNELMTGFIGGTNNPLSKITTRSLVDLGYQIDDATADPLGFTPSLRQEAQAARARVPVKQLKERPLTGPIILIYPDGTTQKVPR